MEGLPWPLPGDLWNDYRNGRSNLPDWRGKDPLEATYRELWGLLQTAKELRLWLEKQLKGDWEQAPASLRCQLACLGLELEEDWGKLTSLARESGRWALVLPRVLKGERGLVRFLGFTLDRAKGEFPRDSREACPVGFPAVKVGSDTSLALELRVVRLGDGERGELTLVPDPEWLLFALGSQGQEVKALDEEGRDQVKRVLELAREWGVEGVFAWRLEFWERNEPYSRPIVGPSFGAALLTGLKGAHEGKRVRKGWGVTAAVGRDGKGEWRLLPVGDVEVKARAGFVGLVVAEGQGGASQRDSLRPFTDPREAVGWLLAE